jgi:hypothetical protein
MARPPFWLKDSILFAGCSPEIGFPLISFFLTGLTGFTGLMALVKYAALFFEI